MRQFNWSSLSYYKILLVAIAALDMFIWIVLQYRQIKALLGSFEGDAWTVFITTKLLFVDSPKELI